MRILNVFCRRWQTDRYQTSVAVMVAHLLFVSASVGAAAVPNPGDRIVAAWQKGQLLEAGDVPENGIAGRIAGGKLVYYLRHNAGALVGYKAGLTNVAVQKKFGVNAPLLGILFGQMLLPSGANIDVSSGARLMAEGDLLVRVKDSRIGTAKEPMAILASLDSVIPFFEVPDLMYRDGVPLNSGALTAINIGTRWGVRGEEIPVSATPAWRDRLGNFTVAIRDAGGRALATGTGRNLLGNPLTVITWMRDELARRGTVLKAGDLLSLGSVTPMVPVRAGMDLSAVYQGLDPAGQRTVRVSFH